MMKQNSWNIIKSLLLLVASFLLLRNPSESLVMLAGYLGAISIIFGIISIISKYRSERKGIYTPKGYFEGVAGIVLGAVLLMHPENMINLVVIILGIVTVGISLFLFSIQRTLERARFRSTFLLISAIMSLIVGITLLFNPFESATAIAIIIGVYLLLYTVLLFLRATGILKNRI